MLLVGLVTSPLMGSGLLTTADSRTAGCSVSTLHFNRPDPVAGREKQTLSRVLLSYEASKEEGKCRQLDLEELITLVISSHEPKVAILVHVGSVPRDVEVPCSDAAVFSGLS